MIGSLLMTCATSLASSGIAEPSVPKEEPAAITSATSSVKIEDYALIYSYKPVTILESEDGYAYVEQKVYKMPYTERSNLYIYNLSVTFVPGYQARLNDSLQTNDKPFVDGYLKTGYFHAKLGTYNEGWRKSGNIKVLTSWPCSSNVSTTITSKFGFTLSKEYTKGQSIELGNGGLLKVEASSEKSTKLSFTFEKTKSSTVDDPGLSYQADPHDGEKMQWSYLVENPKIAGALSYNIDCHILFEMDNSATNMSSDAFRCYYDISYQNTDKNGRKSFPKQLFENGSFGYFY